jgi:hypothetical protein
MRSKERQERRRKKRKRKRKRKRNDRILYNNQKSVLACLGERTFHTHTHTHTHTLE